MKKRRCFYLLLTLFLLLTGVLSAEDSPITFTLAPSIDIPLSTSGTLYTIGGGGRFSGSFSMPFWKPLYAGVDISWHMAPLNKFDDAGLPLSSMQFLAGGASAGLDFEVLQKLYAGAFGGGGYFYAFFNNNGIMEGGGHPYLYGGGGVSYRFTPAFGAGLGVQYRNCLGLYQDLGVTLLATFHPQKEEGAGPVIKPKEKPSLKPLTTEKVEQQKPAYLGFGVSVRYLLGFFTGAFLKELDKERDEKLSAIKRSRQFVVPLIQYA